MINTTNLKRLSLLIILAFLSACSSDTVEEMNQEMLEMDKITKGTFISVGHPTSGTATVSTDMKSLLFTNFKTDEGPKLEVWLTTSPTPTTPSTYLSLGVLQGVNGNYTYVIPNDTDLTKFNHVNIWCVDFSVSFGYAKLTEL